MLTGWYTDNQVSRTIMKSINDSGIKTKHISKFPTDQFPPSIFYGILRGPGALMHEMRRVGREFWYIDNGYFDAEYVDKAGHKYMTGNYRVVFNDMIETYPGPTVTAPPKRGDIFLVIPPSPYSANFYDTTPEDWR